MPVTEQMNGRIGNEEKLKEGRYMEANKIQKFTRSGHNSMENAQKLGQDERNECANMFAIHEFVLTMKLAGLLGG